MQHQCLDGQNSRSSPSRVLVHTRWNALAGSDNETLASVLFCEKSRYCLSESITVRIFTPRHRDTHCSSYEMLPFQPLLLYFCLPPTPGLSLTSQSPPCLIWPPHGCLSALQTSGTFAFIQRRRCFFTLLSSFILFAPLWPPTSPHTHLLSMVITH